MRRQAIIEIFTDALEDDQAAVLEQVALLSMYERNVLKQAARTVAEIADYSSWCGGCGQYVDQSNGTAKFWKGNKYWHHACWLSSYNNHNLVGNINGN